MWYSRDRRPGPYEYLLSAEQRTCRDDGTYVCRDGAIICSPELRRMLRLPDIEPGQCVEIEATWKIVEK